MEILNKKSLRILHLSSENSWRGGEQQIAYLIHELNLQGVQNIVACRKQSAFEAYCHKNQWKYYSLSFKGSVDISTIQGIKNICTREKIDLIHMHSAKSHSLAVLSHVIGNKTPMILSRRVDFPIRDNRFTKWKYNHPAICKIVCVSKAIEQIVRNSIRQPDKCITVYSGIDVHKFSLPARYLRKTYKIPSNTPIIGNTSALGGHKDYYTFVDTAAAFMKYNIPAHFFIMGDGPERETIQQYIQQKGMEGHITMTGFLHNIHEVLPELDIFLMTSETEGLGTSILDAFACRIPVIATKAGGIPEMVMHEKTGLLASIKDSSTLALHVKTIIEQPSVKTALTKQAYQHLINHFTKERMAENTLKVYLDNFKKQL